MEAQPANPVSSGGQQKDPKPAVFDYSLVFPKQGSCKEWTLQVSNQKTKYHCNYFAYADCLTTYFRMTGQLDKKLFLSAQCLVDLGKTDWRDVAALCCSPHYGLMTTADYPYEAVARPPITNASDYQRPGVPRYRVKGFKAYTVPAKIKRKLVLHFCQGPGYACIGSLFVGNIRRRKASDVHTYHHPQGYKPEKNQYHSVVIVGVDISGNESEHYCEIKSSWGKKWAQKGFTKVGFEVLHQIEIPIAH